MPSWFAGEGDERVTLTVTTEEEVVKGEFEIKVFVPLYPQIGRIDN
jgi:hypothetical protein